MDALVVVQRAQLLERAPALRAPEHLYIISIINRYIKYLFYVHTPVRLLVRVVEHVLVVGLLEGEGFATDVAGVRGLAWSWGRHVNIVNCDFRTIWTQFKWLYFLLVAHKRLICLDRSSSGQTNSCQRNFTVFFIIFRKGNYKGFPYFSLC